MNSGKYDKINESVRPSEELAYWTGVMQTDGYLKKEKDSRYKTNRIRYYAKVGVRTSLPMLEKFRLISQTKLGRTNTFWKSNTGYVEFKIGINRLMPIFSKLDISFSDPPRPPFWCLENPAFFGAYLAGIIDGDGNIDIRRPKYSQCAIRIASAVEQIDLKVAIERMMKCKVHINKTRKLNRLGERRFYGTAFILETYASRKNYEFILTHVCKHIAMGHKKIKLESFLRNKYKAVPGI